MVRIAVFALTGLLPLFVSAQTGEAVWDDFKARLLAGTMTAERIRPYHPQMRGSALEFLAAFRKDARPEDWNVKPELHRVGDQIQIGRAHV